MTHTHTLAEWAAMVCIAMAGYGSFSAPYFLLVDASRADFTLRRLLDNDLGARLLVEIVRAKTTVRGTALDVAALLVLLTTRPKGAMA
jgi:hypothetical protein